MNCSSRFFSPGLAAGVFLLVQSGLVFSAAPPELPVSVPQDDWSPLLEQVDRELQAGLEKALASRTKWRKLIARRKLAVGLVDLTDPAASRYAQVNGNVEMYAASLPKIAILLAAFDQFEKGVLVRTPELDQDLNAMLRKSDNGAATRMIDRLGGLMRVNEVLRDPRYRLYDDEAGGGLWVGKRYSKQGPRLPDPLKGISHAATVTQVCRFYYQLATGRLITPEASQAMLEMLGKPGIKHKFVNSLGVKAPDAELYRKSGTWRDWHADSVLVWGPVWRRYILVALTESAEGEQIMRDLVGVVEELLRGGQHQLLDLDD